MEIYAPTDGSIESLTNNFIGIYISEDDNHDIFMPFDGSINFFTEEQGTFVDPSAWQFSSIFKAQPMKTARLHLILASENKNFTNIHLIIEVGQGYITNKIGLLIKGNEKIKKGTKIGEIIIGSRSYIAFQQPFLFFESEKNIKIEAKIKGGETLLGVVKKQEGMFL